MLAFLAIFSGRFPGVLIQIPINSSSDQSRMDCSVGSGIRAENAAETIVTAGNKQIY